MRTEEIDQKIALLPDALKANNIRSWKNVLWFYSHSVSVPANQWLMPMLDLIQAILESGQQNLFRAGLQLHTLIISSKEDHGLYEGDYHIRVDMNDHYTAEIWYGNYTVKLQSMACDSKDVPSVLQPFLDRLWEDTRGREAV